MHIYAHGEREKGETKQKYKSMPVKITSSNECSVRRSRVMEPLCLRVTCKGFSSLSLYEEKSNECQRKSIPITE